MIRSFRTVLFFLFLVTFKEAIAAPSQPVPPPSTMQEAVARQWDWIDQKWTDSDKPYLQIRQQIAALYHAKKINLPQLRRYKILAQKRPVDPVARYRWAYYAYCYSLLQANRSLASGEIAEVSQALSAQPAPKSYHYARLRFLIACSPGGSAGFPYGNGPYLKRLGERLLQRDPKDERVKMSQIDNLKTGILQDEKKALRYAQDIVNANPKSAGAQVTLGFIYQRWSWDEKSRFLPRNIAAKQAINAYQKALELDKTPGKWRTATLFNIRALQKLQAS